MDKTQIEAQKQILSVLSQCSIFARSDYKPPSRLQRVKWWLRIEKRPPPPPPIPAGMTIRIAKPSRYLYREKKVLDE